MKTAEQKRTEFIRCQLLKLVKRAAGGCSNSGLLKDQMQGIGLAITHDRTRSELRWLHDIGLLDLEEFGNTLVATVTERGEDVSEGLTRVDGVAFVR